MTTVSQPGGTIGGNKWRVITQAVIGGYIILSAMVWLAIELDGYPHGAAPPFALVSCIGVIGYLLLRSDVPSGYVLAGFSSILGVLSLALVLVGPHGPPPSDPASPVLFAVFVPGAYIGIAVLLLVTTYLAWRGRDEIIEPERPEQAEI